MKNNKTSITDFFQFSKNICINADILLEKSVTKLELANSRNEGTKNKAKSILDQIDETRMSIYQNTLKPLLEIYDPSVTKLTDTPPVVNQSERFSKFAPAFDFDYQKIEMHSVVKKTLCTLAFSIIWIILIVFLIGAFFSEVSFYQKIAISIGAGFFSEMYLCHRMAAKKMKIASTFADKVSSFECEVDQFAMNAARLENDSPLLLDTLQERSSALDKNIELLNSTLTDAINAASLLNQLADKPIMEGDGALIADIMGQLAGFQKQIDNLKPSIDLEENKLTVNNSE